MSGKEGLGDLPPSDLIGLQVEYNRLHGDLSRLLGVEFAPGTPAWETSIGRAFEAVVAALNGGDSWLGSVQMARLSALRKDLLRIERRRSEILERLRKRFQDNAENYLGWRLEVQVAAGLAWKRLPFGMPDEGGPDFVFDNEDGGDGLIGIECTSIAVEKAPFPGKDLRRKVRRAMLAKAKEPYAAPGVALAIDVTNTLSASFDARNPILDQGLVDEMGRRLGESGFGSLLIFFAVDRNDRGEPGLRRMALRADDDSGADPQLIQILDRYVPANEGRIKMRGVAAPRHP